MSTRVVRVDALSGSYDVLVGPGTLTSLGAAASRCGADGVAVISHPKLLEWYGPQALAALRGAAVPEPIVLPVSVGERSKSLRTAGRLAEALAEAGLGRGGAIVALGGGVVGDLAGFVAAVYHRGIRFIQAPTSLLAQVDAAVGGKVGVDLRAGKNLIGAFLQPAAVIADTSTLATLPLRHVRNGMAEVLKYGFIMHAPFIDFVVGARSRIERRDADVLAGVVAECCEMKARVVAEDERDLTGVRARLNAGHTVGHAIEQALGYRVLLHGEAVSIGMVAEARLSARLGLCGPDVPEVVVRSLAAYSLPTRLPQSLAPPELVGLMYRDKKVAGGKLVMALPRAVGDAEVVADLDPADVLRVLEEMRGDA
jgi:3-dehydroquinate synthase